MSATELTAEEVTESITGFDELAVSKHFDGFDLYMDAEVKPVLMLRALVFIHKRHDSVPDKDAHKAAMDLRLADVQDYFAADEEANPSDPVTDSGKDDSTPDGEPSVSPTSVSPQV